MHTIILSPSKTASSQFRSTRRSALDAADVYPTAPSPPSASYPASAEHLSSPTSIRIDAWSAASAKVLGLPHKRPHPARAKLAKDTEGDVERPHCRLPKDHDARPRHTGDEDKRRHKPLQGGARACITSIRRMWSTEPSSSFIIRRGEERPYVL